MKIDRICIDPGHGGKAVGATFGDLQEKDVTLKVAECYKNSLKAIGWQGYRRIWSTRVMDEYVSLRQRCNIANSFGADLFISLHCNADPDEDEPGMPEAKGEEIWYYSKKGKQIAEVFQGEVDNFFQSDKFRGIKKGNFYVLKHTNMPAILIEMGFIDNVAENEGFSSDYKLKQIALLLAMATLKLEETEI